MHKEAALHFRNQFRQARALVLRDAEAFDEIIFVIERMGLFLTREVGTLNNYKTDIVNEAKRSPLACDVPGSCSQLHISFSELYDLVQDGRNWAMHQGAVARHLTNHATKLAIVLEDAFMNGCDRIRDFMVQNPVCAEMWQPLSFIRQIMLENSFSFLPVNSTPEADPTWKLVSDLALAPYLRAGTPGDRRQRLAETLSHAEKHGGVQLMDPKRCGPEESARTALEGCKDLPILVTNSGGGTDNLLGIVTAFDLL